MMFITIYLQPFFLFDSYSRWERFSVNNDFSYLSSLFGCWQMQLWKYLQNLSFCEKNTAYEHEGGGLYELSL